jgi:type III restriction enzyme
MALHTAFPDSPHAILDPDVRWFPADEALRETSMDKLMPPLVSQLLKKVKEFRDGGYVGATDTSKSLLNWWFNTPHMLQQTDGTMSQFQYYFAQREALETIIYLYDVACVQDKHDMMRFEASGLVSGSMFDETWRRFVIKMATGSGKTKVLIHRVYAGNDIPRSPDDENTMEFSVSIIC